MLLHTAPRGVELTTGLTRILDPFMEVLLVPLDFIRPARLEVTQIAVMFYTDVSCFDMYDEIRLILAFEVAELAAV